MNLNDIATQLLYTTAPINGQLSNGNSKTGTGFFFSFKDPENPQQSIPLLITNYHVLEDVISGYIEFNVQEDGLPKKDKSIKVSFDSSILKDNKLGNLDLVAIPIAGVIDNLAKKNINVFFRSILSEYIPSDKELENLSAIEDLTFIGYPNGLYDQINHNPIIRKGITATPIWNNFKGKPDFLIDGGVYPGSSGSPVFIYNQGSYGTTEGITVGTRLYFVGVIYETSISTSNNQKTFLNLGIAMNSKVIYHELEVYIKRLLKQSKS